MNSKKRFYLLLLVVLLAPWALKAQCGNWGSYDNGTCNEVVRTYGSVFSCPSGHCRWDFFYSGNFTLVSRTANTISLYNGRNTPPSSSVYVSMYDSINNCTGTMDWTDRYMQQTFPDIVGTIPVCPVPLQVYEYTVNRYPSFPSAPSQESITWSITGGTIQSTSNSPLFAATVYDTVRVLWNASGPRRLIASRLSIGSTTWGPQMCTNRDTLWDGSAPPVISGANALCGTAIGTYSIPSLDPAFTYSWSCSNGSITAGQGTANVTVTWLGSGVLTLTRTAVGCGWTDAVTKNVTISASAAPTPVLPPTASACTGQSVALYPGAFTTYQWSNLYTSSTIAPTTNGTYTVTVTNAAGCQATASSVVTFGGTAAVPNLGPNQSVCTGAVVTLNPGTFTSYLWSTGATTQTISPTVSGTYSVTVTNASGCTGTDNMLLTFNAPPVPNLGPNQTVCTGTGVTLNPGTFSTYLWSTGATTPTISPTTTGTYSVTVTGAGGCTGNTSVNLTFNPSPSPNLGPNQSVCAGTPITLNPGTFTSYLWSTGATTQTISPSTSGTYSVTVTGSNGCTGTDNVVLTFNALPAPNLGPDQTVCGGPVVTLNPGTFSAYSWSTGATTQTISPSVSGTYSVTVTSASGCTGTDDVVLTFNPAPSFSLGNDTLICADTTLILDGPIGTYTYLWSTGGLGASITISTGGTYQLTITDANGCTASDAITITGMTDCVFPGDANYDGVANNLDVLSIGAYYTTAGPVRPAASTNWYGQSLPDWGGALPGQADPKHSDCNGDGIVQAVDTLAVTLNYAKTHNKNATVTSGDNLSVVPLQDSISPGDTAWFAIHLGEQNNLADSVYGVAFSVQHSGTGVLQPGIISVDYANCWFAPALSRLDFTHNLGAMAGLDLAITRTDQQNQIGFGEICRFAILTDPSPAGQNVPLTVTLTQPVLVDAGLNPIAVLPVPGSTVVSTTLNSISGPGLNPRIYPNPANDFVRLELPGAPIDLVELYDAFGKLQASFQGAGESEMQLSLAGMADGIYLLHIRSNDKVWVAKQVVRK